jgi:hypothetical protein
MDVSRRVCQFWLDADEPAGNMPGVEHPIHCVTTEHRGDLLLCGKQDQCRLQEAGADHRRGLRLGHRDRARRIRLEVMWLGRDRGLRKATGKRRRDETASGMVKRFGDFMDGPLL